MPEDNEQERSGRVERITRDLLAGRRPKIGPADAPDRDAIMAAAALAGAREPYPRMSSAFRRRLAATLDPAREPGLLSRRSALVAGLAAAVGAVTGAGMSRIMQPAAVANAVRNTRPAADTIRVAVPKWYDAGPLSALQEGVPVRFQAGAVGSYLMRHGESVVGLSSVCTHLPCELTWVVAAHQFNCPCHNVAFDTTGAQVVPPDGYPLPSLPKVVVRLSNGRVEVQGT